MLQRRSLGDWGVTVAAFVLASMVWLHAVTEYSYRREFVIPLLLDTQVTDASGTGQLIVSNTPLETVRVLISGSGKDLLRIDGSDFALRLRPSSTHGSSTQSYLLALDEVEILTTIPVNVEQILDPVEIRVVLEPLVQREIPVRLPMALVIADSYTQVGLPRIEPNTVMVSGPQSRVDALEAVPTDSLVQDQVQGDIDQRLVLQADPDRLLRMSRFDVRVRVDVQELAEYPVPGVPVTVRNTRGQEVAVEPSRVQVQVRGGADVIGHLDPESDLSLYVDYEEWSTSGRTLGTVRAMADDLFEVQQIVPPEVTVIVRGQVSAQ